MTEDYYSDAIYESSLGEIDYTLEAGDTFEDLARAFDTSVEAIVELNPGLNTTQVTPGQNIRLPYRPRFCAGGTIYIVRRGDTLASIANRFGIREAALRRANPFLDGIRLRPGLPLCIPPRPVFCPGGFNYTVRAGDNLFRIAARFGTTVPAILRANPGLEPGSLFIGQRICIPETRPGPGPGPGPGGCRGGFFYTIVTGDTLYGIALRYRTTVEEIIRANPGIDPNRLFIGQQICIPRTGPRATGYSEDDNYYQ